MNEITDACARCGEAVDITDGEPYVAVTIQWERMRRNRSRFWPVADTVSIDVRRARTVALLHESCAEHGLTHTVATTINDTLRSTR